MNLFKRFYYWLKRAVFRHKVATLSVSWGYAWDYLSILEVKNNKTQITQAINNYIACYSEIEAQIGTKRMVEAKASEEYAYLYTVNRELFELVDAVKKNPCLGKELDDKVYERYKAKMALQNKFFPDSKLSEIKVGY